MSIDKLKLLNFVEQLYPSTGNPEQVIQLLATDLEKPKTGPLEYIEVPIQIARQIAAFHILGWEDMKK